MPPSIIVLVNLSAAAEQAARYAAALGGPLQAQLELVNVYQEDVVLTPAVALAPMPYFPQLQPEADQALQALAARLPTTAKATVLTAPLPEAMREAIRRFQPLLLTMSLSPEQGVVDYLLRNHVLPVLRATHHPLLLVPENGPPPGLPHRVLIAVDGEYFAFSAAALALVPLLASWSAAFSVIHVRHKTNGADRPRPSARVGGPLKPLLQMAAPPELYDDTGHDPAAGILRAVTGTQADLLVLIARPRSFGERLFHCSVTARVLRSCPVPVLLLPAKGPDQPAWMPTMS